MRNTGIYIVQRNPKGHGEWDGYPYEMMEFADKWPKGLIDADFCKISNNPMSLLMLDSMNTLTKSMDGTLPWVNEAELPNNLKVSLHYYRNGIITDMLSHYYYLLL